MKNKSAMKIFYILQGLEQKIDQHIQTTDNQKIKSITGYQFYLIFFMTLIKIPPIILAK